MILLVSCETDSYTSMFKIILFVQGEFLFSTMANQPKNHWPFERYVLFFQLSNEQI